MAGSVSRRRVATRYVRRLVTPPLPGDGLLLVGLLEGVVGWPLSLALVARPSLAPVGVVASIVGLWLVLTVVVFAVGVGYTAPTVRRNRVWLVWGAVTGVATAVNLLALAGWLPAEVAAYGYWHPWFGAVGVGYLVTAGYDWGNPQLRRGERLVYAAAGVATLAFAAVGVAQFLAATTVFAAGAAAHLLPIGFDVGADLVLILRR